MKSCFQKRVQRYYFFYELSKESCHFLARFSLIVYICAYIPYGVQRHRLLHHRITTSKINEPCNKRN